MPPGWTFRRDPWLFIHELTHVWQYQQVGRDYAAMALYDQLVSSIQKLLLPSFLPIYDVYNRDFVPNQRLTDYGFEMQATILANFYIELTTKTNLPYGWSDLVFVELYTWGYISPGEVPANLRPFMPIIGSLRRGETDLKTMFGTFPSGPGRPRR